MSASAELNFAGRLASRLGPKSQILDAATGETISGEKIRDAIAAAAAGFLSRGLRTGDAVLIGCSLSPGCLVAYLGAMYAGLVPIPIEDRSLSVSGPVLCAKTRAKGVWTNEASEVAWVKQAGLLHLAGFFPHPSGRFPDPSPCMENDLAALMSTSGSTAQPRLTRVTHGNLIANTEAIIRSQSLGPDERAMQVLPLSYCFGASVIHTHLHEGGGIVFDSRFMFPDKVLRAMTAHGCTTFAGVPTVYNILCRRSNLRTIPLPGLRRFLQAGGALAAPMIQQVRETVPSAGFFVMYGQTEATARISCLPPNRLADKLGSSGPPLDNLTVRIAEGDEIWVKGPSICDGYFDDAEQTALKFQDGWLKTGDLGAVDNEGFLWIKGRAGDFMKIRGVRVTFAEVEDLVSRTPGVFECAANSVPHPESGEALVLFIVAENGAVDLPQRVRRAIPPQWTCGEIHLVTELPRNANGKIARHRLKPVT